ncbi:extracellular solute-binding protein [Cohnella sp. WQ 127256]|uniref:extracellular solute-binding protein n=1 Tax=Cohnella sp. WQ 127256 TaxID=2938790 RepID=UPI0021195788
MKLKSGAFKLLTVLLTSAIVLTACGSSKNTPAASTGASATTPAVESASATPEPAKDVEITVWDQPNDDDPNKKVQEEIFAAFDAEYPHIKVKREKLDDKYRDKYLVAMAGGVGPDAWHAAAFPDIQKYIANGFVLDLTDRLNAWADKDKMMAATMEAGKKDGKYYGLTYDAYVMTFAYNKKLFKEAGIEKPPATWDEFREVAKKLTDPAKGTYGFNILGLEFADWFFEYFPWQAGGDLTVRNDDGTATLTFTSEPVVQALQFYKDLKWTDKVVQKNVVQSLVDNLKDFAAGKVGMEIGNVDWFTGNGMNIQDIGLMPFPKGPVGKNPGQVGGSYWTINAKTSPEKQDAAWTYITYMASKEVAEKKLQFSADNGAFPGLLQVRTDVDVTKFFANIPADLTAVVAETAADPHLEYFLKERLTPYVVGAVQKILLDEKADPKAELQKAQDLAQKEIVDKYNADVLSAK